MINDIYQSLLSLPLLTPPLPWEITFLYNYSWEPELHVMFNLVPPAGTETSFTLIASYLEYYQRT